MKTLITLLIIILLTASAYSDEFSVPFSCYPKVVQAKFKESGLRLDLSANDREIDSWGFLVSKGVAFSIFTYKQLSKDEMMKVMAILGGL